MSIQFTHEEKVLSTPERAFAVLDNFSLTSQWLPPCVLLEKIGDGPNQVGDKLRYVYQQGGRQAEMEGLIADRIEGQRLHCHYFDTMFAVSVDLKLAPCAEGVMTTHSIEITPKSFAGKMMSPLIRMGLRKQTLEAAANLKKLLETESL